MSDKDIPYNLDIRSYFWSLVCLCLVLYAGVIHSLVTENEIVSKLEFPTNCTDADGVTRSHNDTWTSSAGSCDLRKCHATLLETVRWQINYDCPAEIEFLDTTNCRYEGNSSLSFPGCCPVLTCDEGVPVNTTHAACADVSPTAACQFWKDKSNCTDSDDGFIQRLYNFTLEYCMVTCELCTP